MALEAICGMNKMPFMRRFDDVQSEWQKEQLREATSNFENPYELMAPPFERVSIGFIIQKIHLRLKLFSSPLRICPRSCRTVAFAWISITAPPLWVSSIAEE